MRSVLALILVLVLLVSPVLALEPADVWLVVNKNVPESRQVADHYIAKRGVPKGNLVDPRPAEERGHLPRRLRRETRRAASRGAEGAQGQGEGAAHDLRRAAARRLRCRPARRRRSRSTQLRPEIDAARKKLAELEKNKDADKTEVTAARNDLERLRKREGILAHDESRPASTANSCSSGGRSTN